MKPDFKAIANSYNFSCRVFSDYANAFRQANKFTQDIRKTCNMNDRIYSNNGTIGDYCIIHVELTKKINLSVNLNIENGEHRIDSSIKLEELKEQYGNYCDYKTLVDTVKMLINKYKKIETINYDILKELLEMLENYNVNIEKIDIQQEYADVYFESENRIHYEYFMNLWNCDMHNSNDSYVRFYFN